MDLKQLVDMKNFKQNFVVKIVHKILLQKVRVENIDNNFGKHQAAVSQGSTSSCLLHMP